MNQYCDYRITFNHIHNMCKEFNLSVLYYIARHNNDPSRGFMVAVFLLKLTDVDTLRTQIPDISFTATLR